MLPPDIDTSRVLVLRIVSFEQLAAVSHFLCSESIEGRRVLLLFHELSAVLLTQKVVITINWSIDQSIDRATTLIFFFSFIDKFFFVLFIRAGPFLLHPCQWPQQLLFLKQWIRFPIWLTITICIRYGLSQVMYFFIWLCINST